MTHTPSLTAAKVEITLAQYFGPYLSHPDATPEAKANAAALLAKVNDLYAHATLDGCTLSTNPATDSGVSGAGHGGFRPRDCAVGAPSSTHKTGHGVDRYDPQRQFAAWCLAHPIELAKRGLHMEDPRWTPTWVHLQDVPPSSGRIVYIPSSSPALAKAPADWETFA
jgi:hypothetical protein